MWTCYPSPAEASRKSFPELRSKESPTSGTRELNPYWVNNFLVAETRHGGPGVSLWPSVNLSKGPRIRGQVPQAPFLLELCFMYELMELNNYLSFFPLVPTTVY